MKTSLISKPLISWENGVLSYNESQKNKAHREAKSILDTFATQYLCIDPELYEVRSNKGGIAVSGEVVLHTNPFNIYPLNDNNTFGIYIQISDSPCGTLMWRACNSKTDYTGKHNNWGSFEKTFNSVDNIRNFADTIRKLLDRETKNENRSSQNW